MECVLEFARKDKDSEPEGGGCGMLTWITVMVSVEDGGIVVGGASIDAWPWLGVCGTCG